MEDDFPMARDLQFELLTKKKHPNPTQITLSQVSQCAVTHKGDFNYGNEKTENNVVALQLFKYTIFKASQSI